MTFHAEHIPLKPALLLSTLLLLACPGLAAGAPAEAANMPAMAVLKPAHHGEERFRNIYGNPLAPFEKRGGIIKNAREWSKERKHFYSWKKQGHLVPQASANLAAIRSPGTAPQFTWVGHSTVLVQYQGINLLTDPIFSKRCSPIPFLGPKRETPPALSIEELPPIDYVVISHNHYDHLDKSTVRALGDQPLWLVPLGFKAWFKKVGVSPSRVQEFDWWDTLDTGEVLVTATPSQHWSGRTLLDRNKTLWASWHVRIGGFSTWFGGDTGYNPHQFVEIGERLSSADLAMIPIGAYLPRKFMQPSHVDPEQAVQIFKDIAAHYAIGVHWGTFQLSGEAIDAPIVDLAAALQASNLPPEVFDAPVLGQTRSLPLPRDDGARAYAEQLGHSEQPEHAEQPGIERGGRIW